MDENDSSEYNKIPLGHNRTNGAVYSKIYVKVKICSAHQGWGQVQLTKYSSTPSTPNVYQVQVLVKYSFFKKVLKYIKYFHIKYKYKYKYSH